MRSRVIGPTWITRDVDLRNHAEDIVNLLEFHDLADVIKCGHRCRGMVTTAMASQVATRIAPLEYPDAFVSEKGKGPLDDSRYRGAIEKRAGEASPVGACGAAAVTD